MNFRRFFVVTLALFISFSCASEEDSLFRVSFDPPSSTELHVEIVSTPATRQQGLMGRESLPDDRGMLFVFPQDQLLQFWMKNTSIPLSIAYIDGSGRIRTIKDMQPFDLSPVSSEVPVRFALEVNQGWFERQGIEVGDRVIFPPSLPRAQL